MHYGSFDPYGPKTYGACILAHFFSKFELLSFIVQFLGHFCLCLFTDTDYYVITIMEANFDSMSFMQDFI